MTIDRSNYPGVPADFPIDDTTSSVPGAQPKLNLIEEGGKYYAVGTSPSEVVEAFGVCSELVLEMMPFCQRKKKELSLTEEETLRKVLIGLNRKNWCTERQARWVMEQVAKQLNWKIYSAQQ